MADDILKQAEKRRAALQRELDELDVFVRTYKRLQADAVGPRMVRVPAHKRYYAGGERVLSETQKTVNLAREIIREIGKPVPLGALFREFQNRGVVIPGKNPTNTLGARLSNSDEVMSISGFGWWPVDEAYPPAGYDPSDAEPADDHGGPSAGATSH